MVDEPFVLMLPAVKAAEEIDVLNAEWRVATNSAQFKMLAKWAALREKWLSTKGRKSAETRRSYEHATMSWFRYLAGLVTYGDEPVFPWLATSDHVRGWQESMIEAGRSVRTVNQRLAACSSLYTFVIREKSLVDGYEMSLFIDRSGRTRENPFRTNIERDKADPYSKQKRILSRTETAQVIEYLVSRSKALVGMRDYALILTYLLTGYRNREVVSMSWGRFSTDGVNVWYDWHGKRGKEKLDAFPMRAYQVILAYLRASGRDPQGMKAAEWVFVPVTTHGLKNLAHANEEPQDGHLHTASVNRILYKVLSNAGIKRPEECRVHDLRHTFAYHFRQQEKDLEKLRDRLHHEDLSTTGIYAREVLDRPIDDWSEKLFQGMLI